MNYTYASRYKNGKWRKGKWEKATRKKRKASKISSKSYGCEINGRKRNCFSVFKKIKEARFS